MVGLTCRLLCCC